MLGFIRIIGNEFKLLSPIKNVYYAYVRSILENGAIVWDPLTCCGRDQIEIVQLLKIYVAFILNVDHPPNDYYPILSNLDLSSLVDRRKVVSIFRDQIRRFL